MDKGDRVLVTGGSGFVGAAVLRALGGRGLDLRALARSPARLGNLAGADCQLVFGDITDAASLDQAMAGVRYVFHVAADYRLWARDPARIFQVNVQGARVVMEAALAAGVQRVVHTSSVATLRAADGAKATDETSPIEENEAIGAYKRSKVAAERLVEAMVADRSLDAVIVNPSTPIGPGDIRPTPTGRIVIEAASGRIPAFVDTGLNLVHVDDVAQGHILALEKGRAGERYILGGQDATLRELLSVIAELTGRRAPTISLPRGPLYPLAWGAEAFARVTGKEPFVTRDALAMAAHHMFFTSAKARKDLGYVARPYRQALVDALAWFRAAGTLK
ncbi:MAG TPA: hopanoid-associated sugar epimerase [Caulobacteraceae bacterium]